MKRKCNILFSCLAVLLLCAVILCPLTKLTERKASIEKYHDFFEQEADFDVLFMGSSHVLNAVFPMELWHDYGIISYNFGGHSSMIPTSYWTMENALEQTDPKLIVIDCYLLGSDIKSSDSSYSYVHQTFDAFPFSLTKIKTAYDLVNDEKGIQARAEYARQNNQPEGEPATYLGLLWDFSVYHVRWNALSQNDFAPARNREKGAESRIAVAVPNEYPSVPADAVMENTSVGIEYLERIIEECRSRGIAVLLTWLPHPADEGNQMSAHRVAQIAKQYDVNYINFLETDVVNYATDCNDPHSHLNPSGARKVTDYLGQYITEHYDIEDQRGNPVYADWEEDYESYRNLKIENWKACESCDCYLMLAADKNCDTVVEINNPKICSNLQFSQLLGNIGIDAEGGCRSDIIAVQRGGKAVSYMDSQSNDPSADTVLGTVSTVYADNDGITFRSLCLDGRELYRAPASDFEQSDIHITILDSDTGEVMDSAGFLLNFDENNAKCIIATAEVKR